MKKTPFIAFVLLSILSFASIDASAQTKKKPAAKPTTSSKSKKPTAQTKKATTSKSKKTTTTKNKKTTITKKTTASKDKKKTVVKKVVTPAKPKAPVNTSGAIKTASGLTYIITEKGTGRQPKIGDTVTVHYTGTLTNGVKFDSSRDAGKPFSFPLGKGRVIKGWDEGIDKLHVGDHAILILPASLGYGVRGAGNGAIPPNATLVFVVELVDVK